MKIIKFLILVLCVLSIQVFAQQQKPDLDFDVSIKSPKYSDEYTALIGVDDSHNNSHTIDGGFQPFAKLLRADGYQLQPVSNITSANLKLLNTFIIANPIHQSNIGNWKRPIENAFSPQEIQVLKSFVINGGSLMVIADHMPYAGATNELAKAFGFNYEDGFVMSEKQVWPPEVYSKKQGNLYETVITKNIDSLAGFTGSGLRIPENAIKVASFPKTHKLLIPEIAWQFENNTKRLDASDLMMGAIMHFGKGKVAFFTEAAMFTAQIVKDKFKVGFNSPRAPQNKQFVLNVMHWLDNGKIQKRQEQNSPDYQIVKTLLNKQAKAYEANKMDEVANYYTTDAIIYNPNGNEIRGINDVTVYWRQLDGIAVSWKTQILETESIGEQVLAICRFDIVYKKGDEAVTAKSKAILTIKQQDGEFKIYRDFYMPIR
ncbi:DUF4440 domain-containing protein [Winogradskyella sp.]|uniref:YybH family protein n=1 Tax=Winogradskyella sp. TaxID=1883156 RepID=UPI00260CFEF5|nr:DUF4440 domain-containing protein [Winogradskyella sp.]